MSKRKKEKKTTPAISSSSKIGSVLKKIEKYSGVNQIFGRTRQKWQYHRDRSLIGLKSKEKIAVEYLFLGFPRQELLILSTVILGPIMFYFSSTSEYAGDNIDYDKISDIQFNSLENYLLWAKIPLIVLLSFVIIYQWSTIKKDGSFGYWLSLGTDRAYFFLNAVAAFALNIFLGVLLGLLIIIFPGGIDLDAIQVLSLFLLILSSNFLLIGVALLFAEIIKIPEFASISFITLIGLNLAFNRNSDNLLSIILLSEFQFLRGNILLPLFLSFFSGIICILIAWKLHQRTDIEI